jgi:hypothetical protein
LFKVHKGKPTPKWRQQFENYLKTMPSYYAGVSFHVMLTKKSMKKLKSIKTIDPYFLKNMNLPQSKIIGISCQITTIYY